MIVSSLVKVSLHFEIIPSGEKTYYFIFICIKIPLLKTLKLDNIDEYLFKASFS